MGLLFLGLLLLLTSCNKRFDVTQISSQSSVLVDDFEFRLVLEENRKNDEATFVVHSELEYIGNQSGKTIETGSSVSMFLLEEKNKGEVASSAIRHLSKSLFIEKGKIHKETFELPNALPKGEYTLHGFAVFNDEEAETSISFVIQ